MLYEYSMGRQACILACYAINPHSLHVTAYMVQQHMT